MKLGTQTGSLINHVMSNMGTTPEIGMGATLLHWSDRDPATIIEVSKDLKTITVQRDNYKRTDNLGMSDCQSYEYTPDPEGYKQTFTLRKNGRYVQKGQGIKNGQQISIGRRERHYDYSF